MRPEGQTRRRPSIDLDIGNRNEKLTAPTPDERKLFHDFVLEIPGKNQDVVGPRLLNLFRCMNWQMSTGQELPVLVRVPVHGVVEKVGPDTAIVQQGVA